MFTFARKPKATQETTSSKSTMPSRSHFGQNHEVNSIPHLQRTIGNQALLWLLQSNAEDEYAVSPEVSQRIEAARDSGQPLEPGFRAEMEAAFGQDFSGVRVHTDSVANQLALEMESKAFTTGTDVFFRKGNYALSFPEGQQLLAHELTHVVQQKRTAIGSAMSVQRQAETVAFGEKEGTTMVATPKGLAEEKGGMVKEIDEMRASLEEAFRVLVPHMSNAEIIQEALRLDARLWKSEVEVGQKEKSAIAETLLEMHRILDARIKEAPIDGKGLPIAEGVKWEEGSPLAGIVEDILPFGNIDLWGPFVIGKPKPRPKRRSPVTKVEFGEGEEVVVEGKPGKKEGRQTDDQIIGSAIKNMERSNSGWKERSLRMLRLLRNPSADDRVLKVNSYLYENRPPAKIVLDPEKYTFHVRTDLVKRLRRDTTSVQTVSSVEAILEIVHVTYQWARLTEGRYTLGGGGSASEAEKKAFEWISKKQKDPNSVYSCWLPR